MNLAEKLSIALRHSRRLEKASWLWNGVRPVYNKAVHVLGSRGLARVINGTDEILISPAVRGLSEEYEPEVWRHLMSEVRPNDVVADVGAYIGLYTVALGKRVLPGGRVVAFEPDANNGALLKEHVRLNGLESQVEIVPAAVGAQNGFVEFFSNFSESHIATVTPTPNDGNGETQGTQLTKVRCVTLDSVFAQARLDLLKIDVEGYEEMVLRGAQDLLADGPRSPRCIYIEVHPYAWSDLGVTSESLIGFLRQYGYSVLSLSGVEVNSIQEYGEVIARRE